MVKFVATSLAESEQLADLLRQRRDHPERGHEVDAEIRDRFLTTCAIVVLDMSDFSRLTYAHGIITTLQQIQTMHDVAVPLIQQSHGKVLKAEADNLYAAYSTADEALAAMEALMSQLNEIDIHISVGIGYGEVLLIGDRNLFGHEMNLTSKLGEDLARDDEILLTESAYLALSTPGRQFKRITQAIADVTCTYYAVTGMVEREG